MRAAPRSKICRSIKELAARVVQEIGDQERESDGAAAPKKKFWLF
jgi:hypothetical protein